MFIKKFFLEFRNATDTKSLTPMLYAIFVLFYSENNKKNMSKRLITLTSCHNKRSKRDVTKDAFATEESLDLECA